MTEFQPKPQTPEQVDEGLRNAFRQAMKDGVMDATPYLKQMNSNKEIELLKQEIKMLKSKLSLLEEIEKHKSPVEEAYKDWWGQYPELETDSEYDEMRWQGFQAGFHFAYEEKVKEDNCNDKSLPKMTLENKGGFEIVSYNDEVYYRLEDTTTAIWYKRKGDISVDASRVKLVCVVDLDTHRLLEGLWFNQVKKGKYDEPDCPDEPYRNVRAYWGEKDNPKPVDEVINRMVEKRKSKKLWNMIRDKLDHLGYDVDCCDVIVDLVEKWLPEPQSTSGSQNAYVECSVEGFNDALQEIKSNLR